MKHSQNDRSSGISPDTELLLAQLRDAVFLCQKRGVPIFTGFLTEAEQTAATDFLRRQDINWLLYGGFEEAERRMLGVFPNFAPPSPDEFPIDAITVTCRKTDKPEHRSVLGTLMAQGIERNCLGDILIEEGRCVFFCRPTVTPALLDNVTKIGGIGVTLSLSCQFPLPAAHGFRTVTDTVASARLDCIVAALCGVGRSQAEEWITSGCVLIRSVECKKVSQQVREGDTVTVRGKGKFVIDNMGDVTRKGRLILSARKYV